MPLLSGVTCDDASVNLGKLRVSSHLAEGLKLHSSDASDQQSVKTCCVKRIWRSGAIRKVAIKMQSVQSLRCRNCALAQKSRD
jgi:hypothetical protein